MATPDENLGMCDFTQIILQALINMPKPDDPAAMRVFDQRQAEICGLVNKIEVDHYQRLHARYRASMN